jgi:hypothetical protein
MTLLALELCAQLRDLHLQWLEAKFAQYCSSSLGVKPAAAQMQLLPVCRSTGQLGQHSRCLQQQLAEPAHLQLLLSLHGVRLHCSTWAPAAAVPAAAHGLGEGA